MRSGASTPEDLESLFEDALVICDRDGLAQLFEHDAVLVAGPEASETRGREQIADQAAAMHTRGYSYFADPRRVVQVRDTTLIVSE